MLTAISCAGYTCAPVPNSPNHLSGMSGMSAGWSVVGTLLAGVLLYGGVGFLLDKWMGTPKVFLPIGMLFGAGLSTYLVYIKHGKGKRAD